MSLQTIEEKPTVINSNQTIKSLKDVPVNTVCTIKAIKNPNAVIRNRLLSFGLVEGRQIKVSRTSPLGGTICVELIGYSLALRLSEADCLSVIV